MPRWGVAAAVRDEREALAGAAFNVTGPRRWEHRGLRGWTLGDPEPAAETPIRYELAYGGAYPTGDGWSIHEPNPSGAGHLPVEAMDRSRPYEAPRWELPEEPVVSPGRAVGLAGLAAVPRSWSSRTRWGGTYDDAWMRRMREDQERGLPPDYPPDLDTRFSPVRPPFARERAAPRRRRAARLEGSPARRAELRHLPAGHDGRRQPHHRLRAHRRRRGAPRHGARRPRRREGVPDLAG